MIRASRTVIAAAAGAFLAATAATAATAAPAVADPQAPARTTAHHQKTQHPETHHPKTQNLVPLPTGFRPEGITSGPGDTYYAGSMADGSIRTGDLSRGTGRTLLAGVPGRAIRGMQYDRRSRLLWATGQDDGGATGIVLVVDTRTGALVSRIVIPGAGFLNDLVIGRNSVYVTDSRVDRLTVIPFGADRRPAAAPGFTPLTGAWPTAPEGNHANGIRVLRDGTLILDHSTAGGLWAVDPGTGATTPIPVSGGVITGGDGLELDHDTLYVVRGTSNAGVTTVQLRQRQKQWRATVEGELTSSRLDVPSTATLVKHTLWAVNARFGVADPATASYWITPLDTRD